MSRSRNSFAKNFSKENLPSKNLQSAGLPHITDPGELFVLLHQHLRTLSDHTMVTKEVAAGFDHMIRYRNLDHEYLNGSEQIFANRFFAPKRNRKIAIGWDYFDAAGMLLVQLLQSKRLPVSDRVMSNLLLHKGFNDSSDPLFVRTWINRPERPNILLTSVNINDRYLWVGTPRFNEIFNATAEVVLKA